MVNDAAGCGAGLHAEAPSLPRITGGGGKRGLKTGRGGGGICGWKPGGGMFQLIGGTFTLTGAGDGRLALADGGGGTFILTGGGGGALTLTRGAGQMFTLAGGGGRFTFTFTDDGGNLPATSPLPGGGWNCATG